MSYIFLDESGDLGFDFSKDRTSEYFLITCLFVSEKRPIEKIVSKTHKGLKKIHKKKGGILHCFKEKPITRERLLKQLNDKNCSVMAIYLDKRKFLVRLQNEESILYNFITNILLNRIYNRKIINKKEKINLIASRRETNKFLNQNFKDYLSKQIIDNHKLDIDIEIKTPFQEKSLQAVDFISWAIFRKYQYNDETYYNLIKKKIIEENPLF